MEFPINVDIVKSWRSRRPHVIHVVSKEDCLSFSEDGFFLEKSSDSDKMVLYDFLVTVKAAPHERIIRTSQP